jgi:hypothetical protein
LLLVESKVAELYVEFTALYGVGVPKVIEVPETVPTAAVP